MVEYTFLAKIMQTVDTAMSDYVTSTSAAVASSLGPVANQMFTLYVILWGFAMYRGLIQEPILDAAFRLIKIALIINIAIDMGIYSDVIARNLQELPQFLARVVIGTETTTSASTTLDGLLTSSIESGANVWEEGSLVSDFGAYIMAVIIWGSTFLSVGYAAFLIILSKVMLSILIGIGPIFVIALMFEGTKKFFESWIGQALNYALISALAVAIVKLLFGAYARAASDTLVASGADGFGLASIASMLLLSIVSFLCLMQVQNLASSLAGGIAISTMGAVNWAANKLTSATGTMRPSNMRKAFRGVKRDVQALKAGGRIAAAPVAWAARKMRGNTNSISKN